jgi:hypothetical protein
MRTEPMPPPDALPFEPLASVVADGHGLPVIDYCMHAFATASPERPGLRWEGQPPAVGNDQVLLILGPATRSCAFLGGASGPRVAHVVRRGADVVVHVGFRPPFELSWSVARVPRPPASGRLVLVVHGSIMQPPGEWSDAREHALPIATEAPRSPVGATVYVGLQTSRTFDGLEVYVASLQVKRTEDGDEALVGVLRLHAGGQDKELRFFESGEHVWNGYRIRLRGGSKDDVGIEVTRATSR